MISVSSMVPPCRIAQRASSIRSEHVHGWRPRRLPGSSKSAAGPRRQASPSARTPAKPPFASRIAPRCAARVLTDTRSQPRSTPAARSARPTQVTPAVGCAPGCAQYRAARPAPSRSASPPQRLEATRAQLRQRPPRRIGRLPVEVYRHPELRSEPAARPARTLPGVVHGSPTSGTKGSTSSAPTRGAHRRCRVRSMRMATRAPRQPRPPPTPGGRPW
jgi:hypothetical protein